jgi:hypothetical protein
MNLPIGLATRLAQGLDKSLAVRVILEDQLTPISTVHDVVNGPRVLNTKFARHAVWQNPVGLTERQAQIDE